MSPFLRQEAGVYFTVFPFLPPPFSGVTMPSVPERNNMLPFLPLSFARVEPPPPLEFFIDPECRGPRASFFSGFRFKASLPNSFRYFFGGVPLMQGIRLFGAHYSYFPAPSGLALRFPVAIFVPRPPCLLSSGWRDNSPSIKAVSGFLLSPSAPLAHDHP